MASSPFWLCAVPRSTQMPPLCLGLSSFSVTVHSVRTVSPGRTAALKRQGCSRNAMAGPEKYMPTGAEMRAEVKGPCRMRPPKREFFENSSSTCSGLKSPNIPEPSTRCVSVTVTLVPNRSPTRTSSYHLPGNMTYYAASLEEEKTMKRLIAVALALSAPFAMAAYPERPIKMIVPWAAGGDTDNIFRPFAPLLQKHIGQTVVIANVGGASGTKGAKEATDSPPLGYTLFAVHDYIHSTYWSGVADVAYPAFEPICLIASTPSVLTASPKTPWNDWKGLL